jgi:hypothetical protein
MEHVRYRNERRGVLFRQIGLQLDILWQLRDGHRCHRSVRLRRRRCGKHEMRLHPSRFICGV